jgi:hypothetical protein
VQRVGQSIIPFWGWFDINIQPDSFEGCCVEVVSECVRATIDYFPYVFLPARAEVDVLRHARMRLGPLDTLHKIGKRLKRQAGHALPLHH